MLLLTQRNGVTSEGFPSLHPSWGHPVRPPVAVTTSPAASKRSILSCPDVERGVVIPVKTGFTVRATVPPYRKRFWDLFMTTAAHLRRISGIDIHRLFASLCCLVNEHCPKHRPEYIRDGFGQMSITDHSSNVEIFKTNDVNLVDQLARQFVQKVLALVGNLVVQPGNILCLSPKLSQSFLVVRKPALGLLQFGFRLAEKAWVLDLLSLVVGHKGFRTNVNSHHLHEVNLHLQGCGKPTGKYSKPLVPFTIDGQGFDFPIDRAEHPQAHHTDFGHVQPITFHPKAALGKCETGVGNFAHKARMPRFLPGCHGPEEFLKSTINPFQHILEHLVMHQCHIWVDFLDFWQLVLLDLVVQRHLAHPVGMKSPPDDWKVDSCRRTRGCWSTEAGQPGGHDLSTGENTRGSSRPASHFGEQNIRLCGKAAGAKHRPS